MKFLLFIFLAFEVSALPSIGQSDLLRNFNQLEFFSSWLNGRYVDHINQYDPHIDRSTSGKAISNASHCNFARGLFLAEFKRPFTMITVGNDFEGTLTAAATYPDSVFVITEGKVDHPPSNLIILSKKLHPEDIRILSQCEDFDVVYVPNLIETFGEASEEAYQELVNLGRYLFITSKEHPEPFPLKTDKHYLLRKTWVRDLHSEQSHRIYSSFTEKKLFKSNKALNQMTLISDWKPGINLITFKMLGGIYPTKTMLFDQLTLLKEIPHNDWVINNMVLQGNKIVLVDFDDPRRGPTAYCSDQLFQDHLDIIEMEDIEELKRRLTTGLK